MVRGDTNINCKRAQMAKHSFVNIKSMSLAGMLVAILCA